MGSKRCTVFKPDAMCEGFMNRATLRDLGEALSLRFVEIAFDMNVAGDLLNESLVRNIAVLAIVSMNP